MNPGQFLILVTYLLKCQFPIIFGKQLKNFDKSQDNLIPLKIDVLFTPRNDNSLEMHGK
jgi:hypothetical protein